MITLHHLRIGRSLFTAWLLEEVGAEYQLEVYHRDPATMRAPAALREIHPLGKSPVIEDEDLTLTESNVITAYMLEKFDQQHALHPDRSDLTRWAQYQQWLAYPEGSVFAPLLLKMLTLRSGVEHPVISPFSDIEIKLHFDHIAQQLGDNDYILGDQFSGADFGICYVVSMAQRLGQLKPYPTLQAYLQRCMNRPAFVRAVERAVE
ncbi:glutathione S-transferase family protein [Arenicella xantha]|uniref:Glutathione S-transferase n=1 Tax=Arenicella xantha TaxID=644221 RepID=A0A395JNE2_9GAMM|nr:glutathione S-transferase family protein [Arenicella xantha]RBP52813.1 glutathione S-transferase [Arenicella xantha]